MNAAAAVQPQAPCHARHASGPGLRVRGLCAGYPGVAVLRALDLDIQPGSFTVIVGPNGAGKTTLLHALAGLLPSQGDVLLGDVPLAGCSAAARVRAGLVLVAEGRQLFPAMSVRDNLALGGWLLPRAERAARTARVLGIFPRLAERLGQPAQTLSGGEQQMLAVGRALVSNPAFVMLDEPSLGLAPQLVDELLRVCRQVCDEGVTVLLVEQNVQKALLAADTAHVLERGAIQASGPAQALLQSDRIRSAYLGL
jgi:branched-chain amino acid transport system ATP-binding protein